MGAKQTKEDETPTSPKSPRVSPVDIASGDETPVPALLDKDASRGEQALTPKSDASVKDDGDVDDGETPLENEPGRAASQRSLSRRLSGLLSEEHAARMGKVRAHDRQNEKTGGRTGRDAKGAVRHDGAAAARRRESRRLVALLGLLRHSQLLLSTPSPPSVSANIQHAPAR